MGIMKDEAKKEAARIGISLLSITALFVAVWLGVSAFIVPSIRDIFSKESTKPIAISKVEHSSNIRNVTAKVVQTKKGQAVVVKGSVDRDYIKEINGKDILIRGSEEITVTATIKEKAAEKRTALGIYRSPTQESIGLTHGFIHLPLPYSPRLETGIMIGRDVKDGRTMGAFTVLLSTSVWDDFNIAGGVQYGVETGWIGVAGISHSF